MKDCKHENADHLKPGQWFIDMAGEPVSDVLVEQFRCLDCRAWLSLGPARDTAETAVEVHAARLAADRLAKGQTWGVDRFEYCPHGGEPDELCDHCMAFYLASIAVNHGSARVEAGEWP